jgi:hypothetical protein
MTRLGRFWGSVSAAQFPVPGNWADRIRWGYRSAQAAAPVGAKPRRLI